MNPSTEIATYVIISLPRYLLVQNSKYSVAFITYSHYFQIFTVKEVENSHKMILNWFLTLIWIEVFLYEVFRFPAVHQSLNVSDRFWATGGQNLRSIRCYQDVVFDSNAHSAELLSNARPIFTDVNAYSKHNEQMLEFEIFKLYINDWLFYVIGVRLS